MTTNRGKSRRFLGHMLFRRVSLIGCAMLFLVLFAAFHLFGWRDDTAIISGTSISPNPNVTVIRGTLYALTYFLAVVASPILILAAGINIVLRRLVGKGAAPRSDPERSEIRGGAPS